MLLPQGVWRLAFSSEHHQRRHSFSPLQLIFYLEIIFDFSFRYTRIFAPFPTYHKPFDAIVFYPINHLLKVLSVCISIFQPFYSSFFGAEYIQWFWYINPLMGVSGLVLIEFYLFFNSIQLNLIGLVVVESLKNCHFFNYFFKNKNNPQTQK